MTLFTVSESSCVCFLTSSGEVRSIFHISSGDGTPDVVQVRSTLSPSINVTLDGLSVAMGTSICKGRERDGEIERRMRADGEKGEPLTGECRPSS